MMKLLEQHAGERHDHPEGVVVTRGAIQLIVDGTPITIREGSMYVVPAGALHHVEAGRNDTVVIFE